MKSVTIFTELGSNYSFSSLGEYIQMEDIVYNLLNWQSADLTILACAEIIYQLFSPVSPLPRILHSLTKTTIHHGTLKYNMEPTSLPRFSPHLTSAGRRMERKSNVNLISIKYLCI